MGDHVSSDYESLFEAGQYRPLVTLLEGQARTVREYTLLGVALLKIGRFSDSEVSLTKAAVLGDPEAQVELGNVVRLMGRFDEAAAHLEAITPTLTGELQLRALRWWGVSEFQAGRGPASLKHVERAWHGYVALGDDEMSARVAQSLAQIYLDLGNLTRARALLHEAAEALPEDIPSEAKLNVQRTLLDLHITQGEFSEAHEVLLKVKKTLTRLDSPRLRGYLLSSEAELRRATKDYAGYVSVLEELHLLANRVQDAELRLWTLSRLAEHHSLVGEHGAALELLMSYGAMPAEWPAEVWATSGVLARRRGQLLEAEADLLRAAQMFRRKEAVPQLVRVLLHLAAVALQQGAEPTAAASLREALMQMLRLRQLMAFRPDLEELSNLTHYAMLDPDLAPLMEPVLDNLAGLLGTPRLPEDGAMSVQVQTLGRVAVFKDGQEVKFKYSGSAPLLVYIALQPGHTRAEIQLDLYPDKDHVTGSAYVRQALKELRDKLGRDIIHYQGPHQAPWYKLGSSVHLDLDLTHFQEAIGRGDLARALALYRGDFVPEFEDSAWVDQHREQARLTLLFELRNRMARYKADGDYKRFILLANQYLRADPYDREVLEERISIAKVVGGPGELAQYVAELRRVFN